MAAWAGCCCQHVQGVFAIPNRTLQVPYPVGEGGMRLAGLPGHLKEIEVGAVPCNGPLGTARAVCQVHYGLPMLLYGAAALPAQPARPSSHPAQLRCRRARSYLRMPLNPVRRAHAFCPCLLQVFNFMCHEHLKMEFNNARAARFMSSCLVWEWASGAAAGMRCLNFNAHISVGGAPGARTTAPVLASRLCF